MSDSGSGSETTPPPTPSRRPSPFDWVDDGGNIWYCCQCLDEEQILAVIDDDIKCAECGHEKCDNCTPGDDGPQISANKDPTSDARTRTSGAPGSTAQILETRLPFSDSGYGTASYAHRDVLPSRPGEANNTTKTLPSKDYKNETSSANGDESGVGINDYPDDTDTIYSDAMSLSDLRIESYISVLVDDLCKRMDARSWNSKEIAKVFDYLPGFLKTLALQLGHDTSSQTHRDIMVFIHKYRNAIANTFKQECLHAQDSGLEEANIGDITQGYPLPGEVISQRERIDWWMQTSDEFEDVVAEPMLDHVEEHEEPFENNEVTDLPRLADYRKYVFNHPGYKWLLTRLNRELSLSTPGQDIMRQIRDKVLRNLPNPHRISRKSGVQSCEITFSVDWNFAQFIEQQHYEGEDQTAIANAVTLTGTCQQGQALGCRDYLKQTWPLTGAAVLKLIQTLLAYRSPEAIATYTSPIGTKFSASFNGSQLLVKTSGVAEFVAEVAQQLAWMGAALSTDREHPDRLYCCIPHIDSIKRVVENHDATRLECNIRYLYEQCEHDSLDTNGHCWATMFKAPIVVHGFPIQLRQPSNTGMEMPLNMMAALAQTPFINTFKSKVYIKGFSIMLVPTRRYDDLVVWHLVSSDSPGGRISYLDYGGEHISMNVDEMQKVRHIVGWCSDAICYAGSKSANYAILKSGLPVATTACTLDKIEITGGQFVTGTACFVLGRREKPLRIARNEYDLKTQWISSKYVIFWDGEDKRGWLVNGASALLHLLRSGLQRSSRIVKPTFLLNPDNLPDILQSSSRDSALGILNDPAVRGLKLSVETPGLSDESHEQSTSATYNILQHRIEHVWNVLEMLVDSQVNAPRTPGLQIHPQPKRQLKGWDFRDVVADGDPFDPHVATIDATGKGWVDFARKINAVTLFGRGFGELIAPNMPAQNLCGRWRRVPTGKSYMAVSVQDLRNMMEHFGGMTSDTLQLCDGVFWQVKEETFQQCPCLGGSPSECHDLIQHLEFDELKSKKKDKHPSIILQENGAVIFGHYNILNRLSSWIHNNKEASKQTAPHSDTSKGAASSSCPEGSRSGQGSSQESASSQPSASGVQSTSSETNASGSGGVGVASMSDDENNAGDRKRLWDAMSSLSLSRFRRRRKQNGP